MLLISTVELSSILGNTDLLIIDARPFAEYLAGHIPGAVNLDLFAFHWIDTTKDGIRNFGRQAKALFSAVGAGKRRKTVLYDNISGMLAARGLWMLMYLSHPDAVMLDGGIEKWRRENLRIETGTNGFEPSGFSRRTDCKLIIGFEEIRDNLDSLVLVDARSPGEYNGSIIRAARTGHIPASLNLDWNLNLSGDGTFKDPDGLSLLYRMPRDSRIVTYCHGGYRAAHSFLALRRAGFKDVRVYLGSWGEWGNNMDLPVE